MAEIKSYAMVTADGLVWGVSKWDGNTDPATGGWAPPEGITMIELQEGSPVGPGWRYDGTDWTPPEGIVWPPEAQQEEEPPA